MRRTLVAAAAVLAGAAAGAERVPYGEAKPWHRPAVIQAEATEAGEPTLVIPPPNPDWQKPGPVETLTQTGQPPAPNCADGGWGPGWDNGTNPSAHVRMVTVSNECYHLDGGGHFNTTLVRAQLPCFDQRGSLLIEAPFSYYHLADPATPVGGLGDMRFQLSYNAWASADRRTTFLTMLEAYVPSADSELLNAVPDPNRFVAQPIGTGRFVGGVGAGFVFAVRPNLFVAPLYYYEESFAGDEARPDIRRGRLRLFAMYALPDGAYAMPEFQVVTNLLNGSNDVYAGWEMGYSARGTTFYVKPGLGIRPDPNDREWGVEFGVRVQF